MKKIIVVFKTHFDIGFTDLAREVVERYGRVMLPDVVKSCKETGSLDKDHRFVWTMSAWPLVKSLNSEICSPDIIAQARELIKTGQLTWHALPFTTHTEFCGMEDFIRGLYISRDLSKGYDKWPISAKMTDVPGHTWILPSILYKAGIRFLHLGCNSGSTPPDVPRLFFWEGPDGSRVLTFYTKGQYGSSLIPPADWPFPVWLALMQTHDNAGPQKPEIMQEILDEVQEELPDASVVSGTLDDFFHELSKHALDAVPVVKGDLADTWIHGVGTYPDEVSKVRTVRNHLTEAEKAFSLFNAVSGMDSSLAANIRKNLNSAYENILLFGEHTWGLDVKTTLGHARHYKKDAFRKDKLTPSHIRIEESWDEQRVRVHNAEKAVFPTASGIMDTLATEIGVHPPHLTVFNGLGWKRDALVNVTRFGSELGGKILFDAEKNDCPQVIRKGNESYLLVRDLPPLGYKTFLLKEGPVAETRKSQIACDSEKGILENEWFKIQLDRLSGSLSSLKDKRSGREWVDMSKGFGFGAYRYDIYGDEEISEFIRDYAYRFYDWFVNDFGRMEYPSHPHLTFFPPEFEISEEKSEGSCSLIMKASIDDDSVKKYGNARQIETRITLYEDLQFIDLDFTLKGKDETPMVESGYFSFPIKAGSPTYRINKLGSIVDPSKDIVRDCNNVNYCCEHYLEVKDGNDGMTVVPFDTPLFSIGEPGMYKFRRSYKESAPTVCFNAFNNSWGTNFPQWMGGDFKYSFRIIPHNEKDSAKAAFENVIPALAGFSQGADKRGSLPEQLSFVTNDIDGMEVVCLKQSEEGTDLILRLREIFGSEREATLYLNPVIKHAYTCDLMERNQIAISFESKNVIKIHTKPHEIHTIRLELCPAF